MLPSTNLEKHGLFRPQPGQRNFKLQDLQQSRVEVKTSLSRASEVPVKRPGCVGILVHDELELCVFRNNGLLPGYPPSFLPYSSSPNTTESQQLYIIVNAD